MNLKKSIFLFSFLTLISVFFSINAEHPKCKATCEKYTACIDEIKKMNEKERESVSVTCSRICKKHFQKVMKCYDDGKKICKDFVGCVVDTYNAEKK